MGSTEVNLDFALYASDVATNAHVASRALAAATGLQKNRWLSRAAELIRSKAPQILVANQIDAEAAPEFGLNSAAIDRLKLTPSRLNAAADSLLQIAALPDPVGEIIEGGVRPNGLVVKRVRVPLHVEFFIYESSPNVTVDAAGICVKSGNGVILGGGKEALHSNQAVYSVLQEALEDVDLPANAVQLIETADRSVVGHLLRMHDRIDVTIPRGGKSLIERVVDEATMPVIKHYDGICHVYVDRASDFENDGDFKTAREIVLNSKCQRPGVCNAAECLLVHRDVAERFVPLVAQDLKARGVELRCCESSRRLVPNSRAASEMDYRTEFLDLILAV